MKPLTIFLLLFAAITTHAQVQPYLDAGVGLTTHFEGRVNIDAGINYQGLTAEANYMCGVGQRFGASVGYQFGERPFALRLYAGANHGRYYRKKWDASGYYEDEPYRAIKPMAGIKLLYASGAVDLRYTTRDISLTLGFQINELVKFITQ